MGQRSTHSPHDSQTDSRMGTSPKGRTTVSKPRRTRSMAPSPCTSRQVRTQIPHSMHLLWSKVNVGLLSSSSASRSIGRRIRSVIPSSAVMSCSPQLPLLLHVRQSSG